MTLVFTKPTSTFELEFAFGEPKYSPFTIDMEGCGEAGTGHNNYFSGKTAFPPCPKDCWGNGWRDGGDISAADIVSQQSDSGSHQCGSPAEPTHTMARTESDPFECAGDECTEEECCSAPDMDCEDHLVMDVGSGTVLHNNLGGFGPDAGAPTLRYGGVGSLNGRSIDLIVEVVGAPVGGHGAGDTSVNGLGAGGAAGGAGAGLGQINLAFGSRTRLRYTFANPNPNPLPLTNPNP